MEILKGTKDQKIAALIKRNNELATALGEMLHQYSDNSTLSANERACRVLRHPQMSAQDGWKGTCYCMWKKYVKRGQ
jgi:hypothetical protein